nr:MAG TPA: hypothetical protein [Caudoviricetes sp.]
MFCDYYLIITLSYSQHYFAKYFKKSFDTYISLGYTIYKEHTI